MRSPILKVLSSMRAHRVRVLLMGGQACVAYGAAEFSRDTDFAILAETANLARLRKALAELQAHVIAVPPFELKYLEKGHAIHFRCEHPEAADMRVDIMAKMRGVEPFPKLWKRRNTLRLSDGSEYDLLSLPDLVQAKKTQRDKDWPMIRRLVEADYFNAMSKPATARVRFWLLELRTSALLLEVAKSFPAACRSLFKKRPLLRAAASDDNERLEQLLLDEEIRERRRDRLYWQPLRKELERLRHARLAEPES